MAFLQQSSISTLVTKTIKAALLNVLWAGAPPTEFGCHEKISHRAPPPPATPAQRNNCEHSSGTPSTRESLNKFCFSGFLTQQWSSIIFVRYLWRQRVKIYNHVQTSRNMHLGLALGSVWLWGINSLINACIDLIRLRKEKCKIKLESLHKYKLLTLTSLSQDNGLKQSIENRKLNVSAKLWGCRILWIRPGHSICKHPYGLR